MIFIKYFFCLFILFCISCSNPSKIQTKETFSLRAHKDTIWSLAFDPDKNNIAISGGSANLGIWELSEKDSPKL